MNKFFLTKNNRQSSLELLRIISVILILLFHLSRYAVPSSTADSIITASLSSWGMLGANCFVAISSYFLADQKFKLSRIISIFVQMLTYGTAFLAVRLIYDCLNKGTPIVSNLLKLLSDGLAAPFWVTRYWFIWTYILLCIISPFLNILLNSLNKKRHLILLISTSFIIIYGTFSNGSGIVCDLAYFVYIYSVVSYIKRYPASLVEKHSVGGSIIMLLLFVCSRILLSLSSIFENRIFYSVFDTGRHSAFMVIMSIFVFCVFKNLKLKQSKTVNFLAAQALGIYLFHENCTFNLADLLYESLDKALDVPAFLLIITAFTILLFAGTIISLVKKKIIDEPLTELIIKLPIIKKAEDFLNS